MFSEFPRIFSLDAAEIYRQHAYDSRRKLDNVNRTLLVLASGKLVQQKYHIYRKNYFITLATESSNKREKNDFSKHLRFVSEGFKIDG